MLTRGKQWGLIRIGSCTSRKESISTEGISCLKYPRALGNDLEYVNPFFYSNMFIAAFDVESPASFLITIPFPKAQEIIEMFQHNFQHMAEYISFSKNKLVMLNPVRNDNNYKFFS